MARPSEKKPILALGVDYRDRQNDPPMMFAWRKVEDGETLGSIADEYGITWMDLALHNFRTLDGRELNWYLHHFVGCRKSKNKKWYQFSSADNPGMILVPSVPTSVKKGRIRSVSVVRGGKAKSNTAVELEVYEKLRSGAIVEVSGKWIYLFSIGKRDFGYIPQTPEIKIVRREEALVFVDPATVPRIPNDDPTQPGSAFTAQHANQVNRSAEPIGRLEAEIYVSPDKGPSTTILDTIGGKGTAGKLKLGTTLRYGRNWHFLTDRRILDEAFTDKRSTRKQQAYLKPRSIKLRLAPDGKELGYYVFLSPVQLGPRALNYLVQHPEALTPVSDRKKQSQQWDPNAPGAPDVNVFRGPAPSDVKHGRLQVFVKDPFHWGEMITEHVLADSVLAYLKWLRTKRDRVLAEVNKKTRWNLADYQLGSMLKIVRDNYPNMKDIDEELADAKTFFRNVEIWNKEFITRNAEHLARANQDAHELKTWLRHPKHRAVELALVHDTDNNSPVDELDVAYGVFHYQQCFTNAHAMLAGQASIRENFDDKDGFLYKYVWRHFKGLGSSNWEFTLHQTNHRGLKVAHSALLELIALRFAVQPKLKPPAGLSTTQYMQKIIEQVAKAFNTAELAPVRLRFVPPPSGAGVITRVAAGGGALVGMLDASDKLSTWIISPDCSIHPDKSWFHWRVAALEQWFKGSEGRRSVASVINKGTNYGLKGFALFAGTFNLYINVTKWRNDYQHAAPIGDTINAASTFIWAAQDVLAEVAVWTKSSRMQQLFPSVFTTASRDAAAWGTAPITSVVGRVFATVNVTVMVVAGATTTYSMFKGFAGARAVGDTSAAVSYGVGVAGGAAMTVGALMLAKSLLFTGGAFAATGVGATPGTVLMAIGGIIAGIAALVAVFSKGDDYIIFVRKCVFGKDRKDEPRFPKTIGLGGAPAWTHATDSNQNSWPLEKQQRALYNLLGRFKLKTSTDGGLDSNKRYRGYVHCEITPGMLLPQFKIEVELQYKNGQQPGRALFLPPALFPQHVLPSKLVSKQDVFADYPNYTKNGFKTLKFSWRVDYDARIDDMLATVTLRFPDEPNTIRCKKWAIADRWGEDVNSDTETSDIYT